MLYLIESAGYEVGENNSISYFKLLKIGYTSDKNKDRRFLQYKLHNPTCQILYEIPEATEDHEKRVQYKFRNQLYPGYGREWFKYSEKIIEFFKNIKSLEDIENNLPKGNSDKSKYYKYKVKIRKIIRYISIIDNKRKFKKLCEEIYDILGDKITDDDYTINYLKKRFDSSLVEKYLEEESKFKDGIFSEDPKINQEVTKFFNEYKELTLFKQKLKLLCEYGLSKEALNVVLDQIGETDNIKSYYLDLGPQRLRALGYNKTYIERDLGIVTFSPELLLDTIYSEFKVGDKLSLSWTKAKLADLYSSINYKSTPKASDLENFFVIKKCKIALPDKKRIDGIELVSSMEHELREKLKMAQ